MLLAMNGNGEYVRRAVDEDSVGNDRAGSLPNLSQRTSSNV